MMIFYCIRFSKLSEMVLVILEMDNEDKEKYSEMIFTLPDSQYKGSILHIAAHRSLTQIIKYIVEFYPDLAYKTLKVDGDGYYPLHYLLMKKDKVVSSFVTKQTDEAASFLVSIMENERYFTFTVLSSVPF